MLWMRSARRRSMRRGDGQSRSLCRVALGGRVHLLEQLHELAQEEGALDERAAVEHGRGDVNGLEADDGVAVS